MSGNFEIIQKTLESSSLANGGQLHPKQQKKFIKMVRTHANILGRARFVPMTQKTQEIDKFHLGEPVTRLATENTAGSFAAYPASYTEETGAGRSTTYKTTPKFSKVLLVSRKVRSDFGISTETLQENIEGNAVEGMFMDAVSERMSHDFEEVGINGDTTTVANTPLNELRSAINGWDLLTDSSIILDAGGEFIEKQMFSDMLRLMPKEFKRAPGLAFLTPEQVVSDWNDMLSERSDALGAAALQGSAGIAPWGKPILPSTIMRDDRPLATANSHAQIVSGAFGPIEMSATLGFDMILSVVDTDTTDVHVSFPAGTWDTHEIVAFLTPNDGPGGSSGMSKPVVIGDVIYRARYDAAAETAPPTAAGIAGNPPDSNIQANFRVAEIGDGRIILYTTGTATASDLDIDAGTTQDVASLLMLDLTAAEGAVAGTQREGSNIMLCNMQNLIWGILDGTRIFTEFDRDTDTIQTTIYNHIAAAVESTRAVVKATNIRRRTAFPT